ncbi:MAG: hypothetical protein AMXMBFR7_49130 [Planctomycetota bacterium]
MTESQGERMDVLETFLTTLFGEAVSPERRLSILACPPVRSRLCARMEEACAQARTLSATQNVYVGVGLVGGHVSGRGTLQDIVAIPGLWADLDLVAPFRQQKALPASLEDAQTLLAQLPFAPSLVVHSGYGLQPYWLFKEPWVFDGPEDRLRAQALSRGWHGLLCGYAAQLGWAMENLGDLTRVLRLPGTFNRKLLDPVPVHVLEDYPERRYNPQDFEPFAEVFSPEVHRSDLCLRPDAQPPAELFAQALSDAPLFAQTWNGQRPDLSDGSQSGYDLSLATIAALRGWSDQQIANLLIAHRRKHGAHPEKALRENYMRQTIARAMAAAREQRLDDVDLSGLLACDTKRPSSLRELLKRFPSLRSPLIHGLLREGETINVISGPKIGKSWLVIDLALSVATGRRWLDAFECEPGRVLIVDNELHPETSTNRIPKVAKARGIPLDLIVDHIHVQNLRGQLQDLFALSSLFRSFKRGEYKIIVLDAFYRFMPMRCDENDNGTMASLYNHIDRYADELGCAFVLIHHTSKGNQSSKEVTDVGAGAGSQSRATDTHLILRKHEEEDAVVVDAAVRSWPPVEPRCLRWTFPVWTRADDLNPAELRKEGGRKKSPKAEAEEPNAYNAQSFTMRFLGSEPKSLPRLLEEAEAEGLSSRRVKRLIDLAEEEGLAFRHLTGSRKTLAFASIPQPEDEFQSSKTKVESLLQKEATLSTKEVADECGVSVRYVQRIRRELDANKGANNDAN